MVARALDDSYLRETVIAHNIANVDTPYYKRKDVNFQDVLDDAIDSAKYKTIDQAVTSINTDDLNPIEYTDAENFSYRIDRNNVDIDTENAELASEQLRYQALIQSANLDFSRFRSVIK